jgi:hypothetical protein
MNELGGFASSGFQAHEFNTEIGFGFIGSRRYLFVRLFDD